MKRELDQAGWSCSGSKRYDSVVLWKKMATFCSHLLICHSSQTREHCLSAWRQKEIGLLYNYIHDP